MHACLSTVGMRCREGREGGEGDRHLLGSLRRLLLLLQESWQAQPLILAEKSLADLRCKVVAQSSKDCTAHKEPGEEGAAGVP